MRTITPVDRGKALKEFQIREKLEKIPPNSLIGTFVGWALANHKPLKEVCKVVLEQYQETPKDVVKYVGKETIILIENTYK